MTTWPDMVPTQEEAIPDASRAIPKIIPLCPPRYRFRPAKTCSRSSPTPYRPRAWNTAAAVASMARLMIPALIVIGVGFDPSKALVLSQVFLSFGIPFALVPLLFFTSSRTLMGQLVNRRLVVAAAGVVTALIIGLNVYLLATA